MSKSVKAQRGCFGEVATTCAFYEDLVCLLYILENLPSCLPCMSINNNNFHLILLSLLGHTYPLPLPPLAPSFHFYNAYNGSVLS